MLLINGSTSGCSSKAPCCSRLSNSSACSSGSSSRRHVLPPPPSQHHHHHNPLATRGGWRSSPACAALRQEEEIEYPTELSRVDGAQNSEADDVEDAKAREFAIACAEVADQTKCQDLVVLHVSPLVTWCSYMIFATVFSKPQLMAALARLEQMAEEAEEGERRVRLNQPGSSPWECLDYGDVVIHLFTAEQRELYDVEGFYAAADEVELPFALPTPGQAQQQPTWTAAQ